MSINLLIVDDEAQQAAKWKRAARDAGFRSDELTLVASPSEAEERLVARFDIALVDLRMDATEDPSVGINVIAAIHRCQPDCKIIAITRGSELEQGIRAMTAGAVDFISTKWRYVDGVELLVQKLSLLRGVLAGRETPVAPAP